MSSPVVVWRVKTCITPLDTPQARLASRAVRSTNSSGAQDRTWRTVQPAGAIVKASVSMTRPRSRQPGIEDLVPADARRHLHQYEQGEHRADRHRQAGD